MSSTSYSETSSSIDRSTCVDFDRLLEEIDVDSLEQQSPRSIAKTLRTRFGIELDLSGEGDGEDLRIFLQNLDLHVQAVRATTEDTRADLAISALLRDDADELNSLMREAKRGVDNAANELKTEFDPFQSLVIRSQNVEGSEEHLPDSLLHLFTQACHLRASRCAGVLSHEMVVMHRENEVHLILCSLLVHAVPLAPRHAMVEVIRAIAETPGVLEVSSRSVLSACIQGSSNEVLQMLLDSNGILRRLKINDPGNIRIPPLHEAVVLGKWSYASLLVSAGADPSSRTSEGKYSVFHLLCESPLEESSRSSAETTSAILDFARASLRVSSPGMLECRDGDELTPLQRCCALCSLPASPMAASVLIELGAKFSTAVETSNVNILHILSRSSSFYPTSAVSVLESITRALEKRGERQEFDALLHVPDAGGSSPFLLSLLESSRPFFSCICDTFEVDINFVFGSYSTPAILESVAANNIGVVEELISRKANLNAVDSLHRSSLVQASSLGFLDMVRLLIRSGADPNLPDSFGRTPLLEAAGAGHKEIVEFLWNEGLVESGIQDKRGRGVREYAQESGDEKTVQLVEKLFSKE